MSDQSSFYVKIRGRVLGPFTTERLTQMAQQGQFSRVHQVSDDGESWQRATEYPEFFKSGITPKATGIQTQTEMSPQSKTSESTIDSAPIKLEPEWHYGVRDESHGPIAKTDLVNMIRVGQISENNLAWRAGMPDWQPIGKIAEFVGYFDPKINLETAFNDDFLIEDQNTDLSEVSRVLKAKIPWIYFICVFLYFCAVGLFFAFLFGLIQGTQSKNPFLITQSIAALVQMAVIIPAAIFLNRHAASANRFVVTRKIRDLNNSMHWLGRFWMFLSIVLIIWLVLLVIGIVYAVTLTGALGYE